MEKYHANKATPDHNIPTTMRELGIEGITDDVSKLQVITLDDNCKEFGIEQFDISDERQGIVHVVGPEQGITLPGMDSCLWRFPYFDTWCFRSFSYGNWNF